MNSTWKSTAEKTGQPRKPLPEVFSILQNNLKPIDEYNADSVLDECKYVRLARKFHYKNYRLILYKHLKEFGLAGSFSTFQSKFFSEAGATVGIFNELNGHLASIIWRSTSDKDFMNQCLKYTVYGYDMISPDFKFGDWIVITEGIYDADSLRQIYPNVMASLTSSISIEMGFVLRALTNKFIIAYDSDSAGDKGYTKAIMRLQRGNSTIKRLNVFPGDKDVGVMEEKFDVSPTEFQLRYEYYKQELDKLMNEPDVPEIIEQSFEPKPLGYFLTE